MIQHSIYDKPARAVSSHAMLKYLGLESRTKKLSINEAEK
jgi:hypothetical protein